MLLYIIINIVYINNNMCNLLYSNNKFFDYSLVRITEVKLKNFNHYTKKTCRWKNSLKLFNYFFEFHNGLYYSTIPTAINITYFVLNSKTNIILCSFNLLFNFNKWYNYVLFVVIVNLCNRVLNLRCEKSFKNHIISFIH